MSATTSVLPLPEVMPDVWTFAEQQGVAAYLPAVLAMTRRIFPTWPVKVFLEDDPEIANEWHILLEVQVLEDAKPESLAEAHWKWSGELFQHCPSTHVCFFCLGMS